MTIDLLFSEPFSSKTQTHSISNAAEVEAFADELLTRYQATNDILPGIDLTRGGGESLAIAIAPIGWALVRTNTDFDQHCTRNPGTEADSGETYDIRWEEPDSVPREWFIPKNDALIGVTQWIADAGLAPQLTWSDQCL